MTTISRNFRSNIVVGSLVVILPIILTYFLYWAPAVEGSNTDPTMQTSTYENSDLGITIGHPTDWKLFERTSAATNASVVEFIPIVRSEHDPLTPFFSVSVENLSDADIPKKGKGNSVSETDTNDSRLNALTERNLGLAESLPDFSIVETNRTFILSDNPAYKIVYTFTTRVHLCTLNLKL